MPEVDPPRKKSFRIPFQTTRASFTGDLRDALLSRTPMWDWRWSTEEEESNPKWKEAVASAEVANV
jgi:hypothetical protein